MCEGCLEARPWARLFGEGLFGDLRAEKCAARGCGGRSEKTQRENERAPRSDVRSALRKYHAGTMPRETGPNYGGLLTEPLSRVPRLLAQQTGTVGILEIGISLGAIVGIELAVTESDEATATERTKEP